MDNRLMVCDCDCGCDNTVEWHNEPRCACRLVGCPCIEFEFDDTEESTDEPETV